MRSPTMSTTTDDNTACTTAIWDLILPADRRTNEETNTIMFPAHYASSENYTIRGMKSELLDLHGIGRGTILRFHEYIHQRSTT